MPANGRWDLIRRLKVNLLLTIAITVFVLSEFRLAEAFEDFQTFELNAV
jgi:hypothetical protein